MPNDENFVFRLQKEGDNTIIGWSKPMPFSQIDPNKIDDPDSKKTRKQITSIPSPFARIDLVRTAFDEVSKSNNLEGETIYHRIVSDTLDVAQLFFEIDQIPNLEVVEWNKKNDLGVLTSSPTEEHKRLGKTLSTYLKADEEINHFDIMESLYILRYTGPIVKEDSYIGSTSPRTLFFSSANDFSCLSKEISFGNNKLFSDEFCPLHKRNIEFIKSLFAFRYSFKSPSTGKGFSTLFEEMCDYMDKCRKLLSEYDRKEIQRIESTTNYYNDNYVDIPVGNNSGNCVRILGCNYKKRRMNVQHIATDCDFVIVSTISNLKPLVMPNETFTKKKKDGNYYMYLDNHPWNSETKVKQPKDNKGNIIDIAERTLPNSGVNYPYLTIDDFLEDNIIKIEVNINDKFFFDGRKTDKTLNKELEGCYLLPLKDLFFDYFCVDDILNSDIIEMSEGAAGIPTITLKIPVKGGTVDFTKIYYSEFIKEGKFDFFVMPYINSESENNSFNVAALVLPEEARKDDYNMHCYYGNERLDINGIIRNDNCDTRIGITYPIENKNIDHFRIFVRDDVSGLVIPRKRKGSGNSKFVFSIDFGTTNTHIEYRKDEGKPTPFDINEKYVQLIQLTDDKDSTLKQVFEADLVPKILNTDNCEYGFPTRTALSFGKNVRWGVERVIPFAHANIPYTYEKQKSPKYNNVITGLKWAETEHNKEQVRCYIENLFVLLRNKVLLEGGDLEKTKIVWFYPISMTQSRYDLFAQEWNKAYETYFGGDEKNVISMSESIAPYQYRKNDKLGNDIVTVDIGGGTTDVVIAPNDNDISITSFRFAADSIFGVPYTKYGHNGLVSKYKEKFSSIIGETSPLYSILNDTDASSENIASFLFSLKKNKEVKDKKDALDFGATLREDNNNKLVFLLFYSAIFYHIANIMKNKECIMPRTIAFSGNGSKIIDIITPNIDTTLNGFTKIIFEKVYGEKYNENGLTIKYDRENPKSVTCKGGLTIKDDENDNNVEVKKLKLVFSGLGDNRFLTTEDKYSLYLNDNMESFKKQTAGEAEKFLKFFFELSDSFSFKNNFGVDNQSLELAKIECYKDLESYAEKGLKTRTEERGFSESDEIVETSFFYPIQGIISTLIEQLNVEPNK